MTKAPLCNTGNAFGRYYRDNEIVNCGRMEPNRKRLEVLIENPKNACVVAECSNTIVGTATPINYSARVAWIGMMLVDKEFRGQGISRSLLTDILKKLSSIKSVKLYATPAGQSVYKKFALGMNSKLLE